MAMIINREGSPPPGTPKPRLAVVGCGYWGVNYVRLLRDLENRGDVEFAGVCDRDEEQLEDDAEVP